jgi:predicted Zn-dependent protease
MLVNHLLQEGKIDKAKKVLEKAEKVLPTYNVPMSYLSGGLDFLQGYYAVGQTKKAEEVLNDMWKNSQQYLTWYLSLNQNRFNQSQRECMLHFYTMQRILEITSKYDPALAQKKNQELEKLMTIFHGRGGNFGE